MLFQLIWKGNHSPIWETPLDNANTVAESFFFCMKREELPLNYYDTIEELLRDIDEYVNFF